jgi:predicted nucleic acid-binding protein
LILADTSVWIEYLREKSPYGQILRHQLEQGNIVTTAAVFGELLQGAANQKDADRILSYFNALPHIESDGALWIEAGLTSFSKKARSRGVGLVDIAIICAARRRGAKIWSRDKGLLSLLKHEEKFHAKTKP